MAQGLRVVLYAVNGSGVGHLVRLVAIGRWLRRYAAHAGLRPEIYFLTSSEADSILFAERFASFKLPSKTAVGRAGIDKITYLSLAKQWVWHSLGLLRPDLFVVDTFPRGSFGELLGALDLCRNKAFVYRPVRDELAGRADFQAMLPLYDLVLVPEAEGQAAAIVPAAVRSRTRYTGPILVRDRAELLPRAAARARLGIEDDAIAVYVSAGGGGDEVAEAQITSTCAALAHRPELRLVVAAGPLYQGRRVHGEHVRWLNEPGAAELMAGMDLAVAAAGYNTFHELMHAGVPTVFVPQQKIADEQAVRARRAEAEGAAIVLAASDPGASADALVAAVERFLDPEARARASSAARALVPRGHGRDAAAELLRLVLPPAAVDAAEDAITDDLLTATAELGVAQETFTDVMHALAPPSDGPARRDAASASDLAIGLVRAASALGAPPTCAALVASALGRRVAKASVSERAAATRRVLTALAPFGDWTAASTFLRLLRAERRLDAAALAAELERFLGALAAGGYDLYGGVGLLSSAQGLAEAPSNQDALRAASARAAAAAVEAGE
jgi:UDP-N-acetylglucosamine--N-acetylmuramyl-(pentapeptide) pyrophosphoryl-undecaprenol N-acetylglucosamine transferase